MNNLFLKKVLKFLPGAINLSVKSFLVAPPAVIFFGLMYSANFDPQAAGAILSENTKADLAHVWNIFGWISFFTFVGINFAKRAFAREIKGEYFQVPVVQLKGTALDTNSKFISHGMRLESDEHLFFDKLITQDEADQLLRIFHPDSEQSETKINF